MTIINTHMHVHEKKRDDKRKTKKENKGSKAVQGIRKRKF